MTIEKLLKEWKNNKINSGFLPTYDKDGKEILLFIKETKIEILKSEDKKWICKKIFYKDGTIEEF